MGSHNSRSRQHTLAKTINIGDITHASRSSLAGEMLEILKMERPKFHGRKHAGTKNYAIQQPVLERNNKNIHFGATTLETGCEYSTMCYVARPMT